MQDLLQRRRFAIILAALAAAICALVFSAGASAAAWEPCADPIDDVQCARFTLPADRTGAVAGETHVQVYKAGATEGPRLGTLVVIAGGPGQSSLMMIDYMLQLFPGANRYDLLAIDQRGTGLSEPLNCSLIERGIAVGGSDPAKDWPVTQCADALGAARAGYDTAESVADIEAVRADLGVDKISLFGVSYGSKLALSYAKTHPDRVRSMLLDSVLPVEQPATFDTDAIAAMRGALDTLCADGHCRGVLSSPQSKLRRAIEILESEPLTGFLENGTDGKPTKIVIGPAEMFELMFAADFNLYIYEQLPAAIDALVRGEDAALLRLFAVLNAGDQSSGARVHREAPAVRRGWTSPEGKRTQRAKRLAIQRGQIKRLPSDVSEFSNTLLIATSCEDLSPPWPRGAALDARQAAIDAAANALPDSVFSPFSRDTVKAESLAATCRGWRESSDTPVLPAGPAPAVPTLALDGSLDVRTPVKWARQSIEGNPQGQLAEVPFTGHSTIGTDASGCALSLAKRFLIFSATDGKCKHDPPRLPVAGRALATVNQVKALRGKCRGLRGHRCTGAKRAVTAGYQAFRDALDQYVIGNMENGPGLYSGGWELSFDIDAADLLGLDSPSAISLEAMEQVPGVIADGRVDVTNYPKVSGEITVFTPSGREYRVSVSGRVAYDSAGDKIRLNARARHVRINLTRGEGRSSSWSGISASTLRARVAYARAAGTRQRVR
ncbi:MAG: alpha/beta hydrolase [Actinobacteria bacterium]|nr:alpha/beta hydrolase [Actinomycetota bacterium]